MNIADMHIMFRQLAQQMGMQNVRAILPEQIDLLLNTAIIDVVNEIIKRNIASTNDRVITDNSKIGQINALSTLYKNAEVQIFKYDGNEFTLNSGVNSIQTVMTTGFEFDITCNHKPQVEETAIPSDYMYICDFNINYYTSSSVGNTRVKTDWFPVRIIDDIYVADALNDFILAPFFRSPIAHIVNREEGHIRIKIYIDRKKNNQSNIPNGVPYEAMIPKCYSNSLVACRAYGASHVGLSSIRLVKTMMDLGHSAGIAIKQLCYSDTRGDVRTVDVSSVQDEIGILSVINDLEAHFFGDTVTTE